MSWASNPSSNLLVLGSLALVLGLAGFAWWQLHRWFARVDARLEQRGTEAREHADQQAQALQHLARESRAPAAASVARAAQTLAACRLIAPPPLAAFLGQVEQQLVQAMLRADWAPDPAARPEALAVDTGGTDSRASAVRIVPGWIGPQQQRLDPLALSPCRDAAQVQQALNVGDRVALPLPTGRLVPDAELAALLLCAGLLIDAQVQNCEDPNLQARWFGRAMDWRREQLSLFADFWVPANDLEPRKVIMEGTELHGGAAAKDSARQPGHIDGLRARNLGIALPPIDAVPAPPPAFHRWWHGAGRAQLRRVGVPDAHIERLGIVERSLYLVWVASHRAPVAGITPEDRRKVVLGWAEALLQIRGAHLRHLLTGLCLTAQDLKEWNEISSAALADLPAFDMRLGTPADAGTLFHSGYVPGADWVVPPKYTGAVGWLVPPVLSASGTPMICSYSAEAIVPRPASSKWQSLVLQGNWGSGKRSAQIERLARSLAGSARTLEVAQRQAAAQGIGADFRKRVADEFWKPIHKLLVLSSQLNGVPIDVDALRAITEHLASLQLKVCGPQEAANTCFRQAEADDGVPERPALIDAADGTLRCIGLIPGVRPAPAAPAQPSGLVADAQVSGADARESAGVNAAPPQPPGPGSDSGV